jgi:ubiquitin carboxyl-terminal hydrolase 22/27/51
MGSTCFMSVILQSFVHNPLLRSFYLGDGHDHASCMQDECLSCGVSEFFHDFYGQDTTAGYIAADILATSWTSQQSKFKSLSGDDEKDAHEFFQFLAEVLHETAQNPQQDFTDPKLNGNNENKGDCKCIMHRTFYGQIQQSMTCHTCNDVLTTFQPFLDLNLGLEGSAYGKNDKQGSGGRQSSHTLTLQGCLEEEYTDAERIEQYTCYTCGDGLQGAKVQRSINRLPKVLSIQFKVILQYLLAIALLSILNLLCRGSSTTRRQRQAPKLIRKSAFLFILTCCLIQAVLVLKT